MRDILALVLTGILFVGWSIIVNMNKEHPFKQSEWESSCTSYEIEEKMVCEGVVIGGEWILSGKAYDPFHDCTALYLEKHTCVEYTLTKIQ